MNNNEAVVCTLQNISKIPNADKIVQSEVWLNGIKLTQVVVGLDSVEGQVVTYFDSNLQLSDQVIKDYPDLATYLSKGNRVRAIKLKGVFSSGLVVDVSKFYKYGDKDKLIPGYSFCKLGDTEICKKYYPPIKSSPTQGQKKGRKGKQISRMIEGQFRFHIDTELLLKNYFKLRPDSVISISRKQHGTSSIISNCLVKKQLKWYEKILKKIGINIVDTEYSLIVASRTVVKNDNPHPGFYKEDIWTSTGKEYFQDKLHKGETAYYEILGYLESGSFIQKGYDYNCLPGQHKIAVYRITSTGLDGTVYEYGWQAMKERCIELNVPMVEEFYYGRASDLFKELDTGDGWNKQFVQRLIDTYLEKKAPCINDVPDEGIVIRVEGIGIEVYKLKSEAFTLRENKMLDEEVVDIEATGME